MAISTDPAVLAAASRCFDTCIPPGEQRAVQTYLWAQITGVTDPATILINARCFNSCIPLGLLPYLQAYLAAILAGGSTDPSTLANAASCFRSCVPVGGNNAIITYELANKAGGSTDPATLANLARCFSSCIPDGFQLAAQAYLMAVAAGGSTDPGVLAQAARCFSSCIPAGLAPSVVASSVASYAAGPTCPVPALTAVMQSDLTVVVSWNAPPAGIDYTEIWESTDNVTFVLAWVVAAPGTTTTLPANGLTQYFKARFCTGTVQSLLGLTWAKQVVTNGGAYPSSATTTAVDTFLQGLVTDGLNTLIVNANVFAPDSLTAALTPPVHNSGLSFWVNHNFVAGDLTINGLLGDGSSKYLDTGVLPVTAGLVTTEGALAVYDYDKNTTASGIDMGYGTGAADWILISNFITAGIGSFADCYNNTTGRVGLVASPGNGFYAQSRTGAAANALYFANSVTPFAAISSNAGSGAGITDTSVFVFATNPASQYVNARISFAAVCHGLTLAQMQNLYNRVQTLRTSFGGGFR